MGKRTSEPYAAQVWMRYRTSKPQCIASGATTAAVALPYVAQCEVSDCETVLIANWANGGDPNEGPLRTIVSRSEGSTLALDDCVGEPDGKEEGRPQ